MLVLLKTWSCDFSFLDNKSMLVMEDFVKEALLMSKFKHPNVLGLVCISVKDNVPCLVQPHMVHGDLKTHLKNSNEVKTHSET